MLKNRVITALVIAPLALLAVWFLPPLGFAVAWGAIILLAAWEWSGLSGLEPTGGRVALVVILGGLMATGPSWADYALDWLAWPVVAWWFVIGLLLRRIPAKLLSWKYPLFVKLLVGLFVLASAWILLVWTRVNFGVLQVLYLLLLVWSADVAAYFTGKRFGTTKLAPEISPGKTVEGLYGALAVALAFAVTVGLYQGYDAIKTVDFVLLSIVTVIFSVTGDLFESLLKRLRGVKDSGAVLPGHGGVLDRIDSLIAAVSVFYAGSFLLEVFLGSVNTIPVIVPDETGMLEQLERLYASVALMHDGAGRPEGLL
ncbi:phosphatidate cytidylyltransferase [Methylococcus sp. EFPC2]|uniref:phosphatidate cytidylyltransferase n=1 Tax=Methylococcus sp. EFPC2 TaxID=2812648 RepID=UPI001966E24C|nr:phosphatidate cytidylyltransferase [Methylococcus sp. EFPC2]QSA98009.1 phosphatidate cytidylyltransferase [Methylococcus sp. EFPC2]